MDNMVLLIYNNILDISRLTSIMREEIVTISFFNDFFFGVADNKSREPGETGNG